MSFSAIEPRSVLPSHTRVSSSSFTPSWAAIQSRSRVSKPATSSWASSSRKVESEGDFPKSVPSSSLSERLPVAFGKSLHAHQRALAAQDREDRHQQHPPLRKANAAAHPAIRQRLEKTDQIACSSWRGGGLGGQGSGAVPAQNTVGAGPRPALLGQTSKSLLKNPAISAKMGQLPSPDARSPGAQRLPVLLRVDRGADSAQSSAAADPETGGSGP